MPRLSAGRRRETLWRTDWERRRLRYPRSRRPGFSVEAVTLPRRPRVPNAPERAKSRLAGPGRNRRSSSLPTSLNRLDLLE